MKKEILLLSLYAVFILSSCSSIQSEEEKTTYKVVNPVVKDTVYTIEYVTEIHAIRNVEVRSRVGGFIENLYVDEGQFVKQGQLLFTISSNEFLQNLQKAQAITQSVRAELKSAEIELKNSKKLLEKKIIGQPEYDLALAKTEVLKAKVNEAVAEESKAALQLSYAQVKAPFEGAINRLPYKPGSLIEEGTLLTSISNNKEVFAYFNVSENDYLQYLSSKKEEQSELVSLLLANGAVYKHSGVIETTVNEFDRSTGNIAFRAKFPNPDGILKHGASGVVQVKTVLKNALIIPQKSTFEVQENVYVFVVDKENKVRQRRVVPAFVLPHLYIIRSGLSPQDKIVYEGIQKLKDGDEILAENMPLQPPVNNQ